MSGVESFASRRGVWAGAALWMNPIAATTSCRGIAGCFVSRGLRRTRTPYLTGSTEPSPVVTKGKEGVANTLELGLKLLRLGDLCLTSTLIPCFG